MSDPYFGLRSTDDLTRILQENRRSWEFANQIQWPHRSIDAAIKYFRNGGRLMPPEVLACLGRLPVGIRVLQPFCNDGRELLSLSLDGATVTGVDFSKSAVRWALSVARELGISGHFHCEEALAWLERSATSSGKSYDLMITTLGSLSWISDIDAFFGSVCDLLESGGRFMALDFHPTALELERCQIAGDAGVATRGVHRWPNGVEPYLAENRATLLPWTTDGPSIPDPVPNPYGVSEWRWRLTDLIAAVDASGLTIERLEEYDYVRGEARFDGLVPDGEGRWRFEAEGRAVPLMVSLVANRP